MDRKLFFSTLFSRPEPLDKSMDTPALKSTLKKYKGKWDTPAVVHFLKHTMFGAKPEDIAFF